MKTFFRPDAQRLPLPASLLMMVMLGVVVSGCATLGVGRLMESEQEREQRLWREAAAARHAAFRAQANWRRGTFSDPEVLPKAKADNTRLVVSLADQRTVLLADGAVALDVPCATGKRSHPTPKGEFAIIEKTRDHASNLYGKIYDAEGKVIATMADRRKVAIPEGGRFEGSKMPFWMRLTPDGVGFHVGQLPGRPASHGCIRLPRSGAEKIYSRVKVGTPVEIVEQWTPPQPPESARAAR